MLNWRFLLLSGLAEVGIFLGDCGSQFRGSKGGNVAIGQVIDQLVKARHQVALVSLGVTFVHFPLCEAFFEVFDQVFRRAQCFLPGLHAQNSGMLGTVSRRCPASNPWLGARR